MNQILRFTAIANTRNWTSNRKQQWNITQGIHANLDLVISEGFSYI